MSKDYSDILNQNLDHAQIGDFKFYFRGNDIGGTHYKNKLHIEEYYNPLYRLIKKEISPKFCVDVGANYGLTGLIMRKQFPNSRIILIEPIPWIKDYIDYNFEVNNQSYNSFYSRICSFKTDSNEINFGVNEKSSQDSRVVAQPSHKEITTKSIALSDLLIDTKSTDGVYIKIDTQGWEQNVLKGAESFLDNHDRWFIKAEFGPMWLLSQGTNPEEFLEWLIDKFDVYESTGRIAWSSRRLRRSLGKRLKAGCAKEFTRYITNLDNNNRGWVDLYIMPKLKN